MNKLLVRLIGTLWVVLGVVSLGVGGVAASPSAQGDLVAQGKYLATVSGCVGCHTPLQPQFADAKNITPADRVTMSLSARDALDTSRLLAGGQTFNLGPAGVLFTANLTPDPETGIGKWTDEELKTSIRTGASRAGRLQHAIMPYRTYNNMAESDINAIVAYLRSVPAVKNTLPANTVQVEGKPLAVRPGLTAPASTDTSARGKYLMTAVLNCSGCHTQTDKTTGKPMAEKAFAGAQPFEGTWGIVYSANLTPHETGLASWSDADIRRVLSSGVRRDGRRLVLMIWQDVANLNDDDAKAVVNYLRKDIAAVENIVPAPALKPEYEKFVELPALQKQSSPDYVWIGGVTVAVLVVVGSVVAFVFMRRKGAAAK